MSKFKFFGAVACTSISIATSTYAADGGFQAFSWSSSQVAATTNVLPLYELSPWTDLKELTVKLNALPAGRRWVIVYCVTDKMAEHPADRCVKREVKLVTRYIQPQPTSALSKASPSRSQLFASAKSMVPVTQRVIVDTPTAFRGPWIDNGVAATRASVMSLFTRLRAAGAQIDGIAVDNETNLGAAFIVGEPGTAAAIQSDPRWPALATTVGLPLTLSDMNWGTPLYFNWTDKMTGRFDSALNQAVFEPAKAIFPNASVSNYNSGKITNTNAWPDINGHLDRKTTPGFGTHDTHEFYGWLAPGRISKVKGTEDASSAWLAFRLEIFKARGMIASSNRPRQAWIAAKSWPGETWGKVALANTALWDELILQLGMHGFNTFLEFSPNTSELTLAENNSQRVIDRAALDAALSELNRVAGQAQGAPQLVSQPTWNDRVIATGRSIVTSPNSRSGNLNSDTLWRFSFDETISSVLLRFTDGSTKTLSAESGRYGCWYIQPAGKQLVLSPNGKSPAMEVTPVASSDPVSLSSR